MDSYKFNKIAGAVLGTALVVVAVWIIFQAIYKPGESGQPDKVVATATEPAQTENVVASATKPAQPDNVVASATAPAAVVTASPPSGAATIAVRLASASVDAGADIAKKCLACHTLMKDQPAKVGPNLWGVVGGPAAHMASFKYSEAMLKQKADNVPWTFENLDVFLTAPKMFIPGTTMGFPGLPKAEDRANVIAYLRTLADNPVPLPAADAGSPPANPAGSNPNAPPHSDPLPPPAPQ